MTETIFACFSRQLKQPTTDKRGYGTSWTRCNGSSSVLL